MARDHSPITINDFGGLFDRDDPENCPPNHFSSGQNFKFVGNKVVTRDALIRYQNVAVPLGNIVRTYNYVTQTEYTQLHLTWDGVDGKIYHVTNETTVFGPILTLAGMTDFAFVSYNGRAYISPFVSIAQGDLFIEKGMQNQFLYVYKGDGTAARKAAGSTPAGTITIANGAAGNTDAGLHLFGVVGESDTGFLSAPYAIDDFTTSASSSVSFSNIPVLVGSQWVKRHIVASKVITDYTGNTLGYNLYFIPDATINDNVGTVLNNISFFDSQLLELASYLHDNYTEIPAGAVLSMYHNRLVLATTFTDISLILVSAVGEPEAISQVSGLMIFPPDGNPITNAQELRDILYVTKRNKTGAFTDNDDEPSTWPFDMIDPGMGTSVHGVATVLDEGTSNIDFLILATYRGIALFNGKFIFPELSWKIAGLWGRQDRTLFKRIQLVNDTIDSKLYCVLPDRTLLVGYYDRGLDAQNIRWTLWTFEITINTIALVNINDLIIGAETRIT